MSADNSRAPNRDRAPCVLIADNDEGVNAVLSVVLDRVGLSVATARNGAEALDVLEQGGVDALVCDLDMPKMSGEELLGELQAWDSAPPIIVISGFLDSRLEERLAALRHVRAVLRKPFDVLEFGTRLQQLMALPAADSADSAGATAPTPFRSDHDRPRAGQVRGTEEQQGEMF